MRLARDSATCVPQTSCSSSASQTEAFTSSWGRSQRSWWGCVAQHCTPETMKCILLVPYSNFEGEHIARRPYSPAVLQDHLLPEEYVATFRLSMLDNCPVSTFSQVVHTINEDLGAPPSILFAEFDEEPVASASLAQASFQSCKHATCSKSV